MFAPLRTGEGENNRGEGIVTYASWTLLAIPAPFSSDSTRKNSPDFRPQFSSFQQINLAFTVADTVSNIKRGTVDVRNGQ